jgi:hypothetical protein
VDHLLAVHADVTSDVDGYSLILLVIANGFIAIHYHCAPVHPWGSDVTEALLLVSLAPLSDLSAGITGSRSIHRSTIPAAAEATIGNAVVVTKLCTVHTWPL